MERESINTDSIDKETAKIVCTTCKQPISARLASRCMACGEPTCSRCSIAGFCKEDITRLEIPTGEHLVAIDHAMKHSKHASIATTVAAIGLVYCFLILIFTNIVDISWFSVRGSLFLLLLLLCIPFTLLILVQYRFVRNFKNAIHTRDDVLRDSNVNLNYPPRKGYPGRDGKLVTYTCAACHGPVHVNHATCAICYVALCPKCVSQGLCPGHAAALSTEEKEQLTKSGEFPSRIALYTMPLMVVVLGLMSISDVFDLPVIFMVFPILLLAAWFLKVFSIMHSRQMLRNKYKGISTETKTS
ncbi:MAG TPA: hypothetical protein VKM55_14760 [Candidatus Lokiarchaeia archaeon]|nr:hypothetical protein [Candidatus Lokiarchaeia archaeon]